MLLSEEDSFDSMSKDLGDPDSQTGIKVRHYLKLGKVRVLVSKKILELIQYHVIRGLDFKRLRKTHYAD
jgi:hypothetical protein